MTVEQVCALVGCSRMTVTKAEHGYARAAGAHTRRPKQAVARFKHEGVSGKAANMPPFDHPALMEGRTIYPTTVVDAAAAKNILKSGMNAAKIGALILKGRWKGFPVYTLTLEERATCPTSCRQWRSCMGNHMHFAPRLKHNETLLLRLERELGALARQHPAGFAVRLHVLGDFFSVAYVDFWRRMLTRHAPLHIFGFTARWQYQDDPIARAIVDLAEQDWSRFAIRFSNAPVKQLSTITIEHPLQKPADAIICPAQLGKTEACSTCALCW